MKSKITDSTGYEDENGDCDSKENISKQQIALKFDGKKYQPVLN